MAKFGYEFGSSASNFSASASLFSELTSEELLDALRPAAETLKSKYISVIRQKFSGGTGEFAESIRISEFGLDRKYMDLSDASISVGPAGKRKKSKRGARNRAGPKDRKGAKHNRIASATFISNAELGYLLEYGTPRVPATHWMENANEEIEDEIANLIEEEFDKLLRSKGLL